MSPNYEPEGLFHCKCLCNIESSFLPSIVLTLHISSAYLTLSPFISPSSLFSSLRSLTTTFSPPPFPPPPLPYLSTSSTLKVLQMVHCWQSCASQQTLLQSAQNRDLRRDTTTRQCDQRERWMGAKIKIIHKLRSWVRFLHQQGVQSHLSHLPTLPAKASLAFLPLPPSHLLTAERAAAKSLNWSPIYIFPWINNMPLSQAQCNEAVNCPYLWCKS